MNNLQIPNIKDSLDAYLQAKELNKYPLSYSQMSMYWTCPYSWQLKYVNSIKTFSPSIHLVFGNAMHKTIQDWLDIRYKDEQASNNINLSNELQQNIINQYKSDTEKQEHFSTADDLNEFYLQGVSILQDIKNNVSKYFPTKNHKLIGIEMPIFTESNANENVLMVGFIDLVILNTETGVYALIDIKTSGKGWGDFKKKEFKTNAQLLTYKQYFSKQYKVELDKIDIQFFVVKRILYEGSKYTQSRIQQHVPANGKVKLKELNTYIDAMIKSSFLDDGGINKTHKYPKTTNNNNCRFCDYKGSKYCNKHQLDENNVFNK